MNLLANPFPLQSSHLTLLNALEGICYICAFDGEILAIGEDNWTEFAISNAAQHAVSVTRMIGTNIFDYISGDEVNAAYTSCFNAIRTGRTKTLSFTFRCDTPNVRRDMRMCLSAIHVDRAPRAVLFQSLAIEERERPAVNLFDFAKQRALEATLPIIALCSYCQNVKLNDAWVSAEAYYAQGGAESVRISHGICPECHRTKIPG